VVKNQHIKHPLLMSTLLRFTGDKFTTEQFYCIPAALMIRAAMFIHSKLHRTGTGLTKN